MDGEGVNPGRRTRGLARWWSRCTRWVHRLGAPRDDVKVRIPVEHAPRLADLYPVRRGDLVIKAQRMQEFAQAYRKRSYATGGVLTRSSHWTGRPIKLLDISIQELADSEDD